MQIFPNKSFHLSSTSIMVAILAIAVLLRCAPIVFAEFKEPGWHEKNVNEIEFYYDDVARSLIAGKGFVHSVNPNKHTQFKFDPGTPFNFVPPLYAWYIFLIYKIFGPSVFVAKIFTAIMDALVCLMIYLIGKKLFKNDHISLLGAGLYAVYPLSIVMTGVLYYQIPMNILLCWLLICLIAPMTIRNGAWTGVALGLSALAKPVTLPLLLILPFLKAIECFVSGNTIRTFFKWTLPFIVTTLAVLTPWTIRNYVVFNEFIPVQRGGPEAFFQGSKIEYIDSDVDTLRKKYKDDFQVKNKTQKAVENHLDLLKREPLSYASFLGKKFALAWYNTESKIKNNISFLIQIPFLIFATIGTFAGIRFWSSIKKIYLHLLIFFIVGIQVIIFPLMRYTLVIMPLIMILASVGIFYIFSMRSGKNFTENNL